jgi:MoxR-like ATPase
LGAFLSGGHVLIEDIPGVGKTTLVKTLAKHLEAGFQRVQFTPDLLPSDLIGVSIYHQESQSFHFKKGPIFTQLLMADEINRASPKTQSSLLEAMEEKQVTIDGATHPLSDLFMVIATQNPIEFEGTFPLPEAQMDRFMIQVSLGYPDKEQEMMIYKKETHGMRVATEVQLTQDDVRTIKEAVNTVHVSDLIYDYVQRLVEKSRKHDALYYGLSPRAGIAIIKMAKYQAFMENRTYVIPEDVKTVAPNVMRHRLILKPEALYKEQTAARTVEEILNWVNVPKGSFEHGL